MKVIGLTGGIASGKSTAARTLAQLGALVIDTDQIAREIVYPGKPAWNDIVEYFGPGVLNLDSSLDRKALAQLVFSESIHLAKLNSITHPKIVDEVIGRLKQAAADMPDGVVVLEVPLLYETGMEGLCDEVWVIWIDRETQIKRLRERDGITRGEAIKRIDAQMSLDEKAACADVVIDNRYGVEAMIEKVTKIYNGIVNIV